jgi:hypothetical protein
MKILMTLTAAAIVATLPATSAMAREGCGPGFHRARDGQCRPNRGTQMRWMEGHYYRGQGYWHQNRWYHQRHRHNGTWVYINR